MMYDQNGERIGILKRMLESIASVYNLARETGISSVRFLNSAGVKNVVEGDVHQTLNGREYAGITRVGTGLKEKVLRSLVVSGEMSRPMLVIVMVGQEVRLSNSSFTLFKPDADPSLARGRVSESVALRDQRLSH